jgi:hypothetical protein
MVIDVIPREQIGYEDNVINFWKKICALPRNQNPAVDNSGDKDEKANNARDPYFYLCFQREGASNRSCNVPPGKGLFIPPLSVIATEFERPNSSVKDLVDLTTRDQESVEELSVELDGIPVQNLDSFITTTPDFRVEFPEDPIFEGKGPRNSVAVAGGRYLITKPLSKGKHTVHIKGKIRVPPGVDALDPAFDEDLMYTLTVS